VRLMVVIRLSRSGAKKRPFYHVVVSDSRKKRDGRYIERVGFSNPVAGTGEDVLRLDRKRIEYWQAQGAQTSLAVQRLLRAEVKLVAKQEQEAKKAEKSKFKPAQVKAAPKTPAAADEKKSDAAPAPAAAAEKPAAKPEPVADEKKADAAAAPVAAAEKPVAKPELAAAENKADAPAAPAAKPESVAAAKPDPAAAAAPAKTESSGSAG
ncbi:MAG: 30S ribosomal protein S16, partial [Betaproteobacteria bacterium]|nr:30S ribosomal protein S16 [Betaproteobacteria bacterium]